MAADAWVMHDSIKEYIEDGTVDLDNDSFKVALFLSTSNVATTSINALASATKQHANANGYITGGVTVVAPTWTRVGGIITFDSNDIVFTASGGSIVARYAVLYDDTVKAPVADPIICHVLMDNAPADIIVPDTNTLTIQPIQLPTCGFF